MRINLASMGVLVAATLCVAPAARPASLTMDRPNTTLSVLQEIQNEVDGVKMTAGRLQALLREPFLNDWKADADLLEEMRGGVNEMNRQVSRLRSDEAEITPSERKVVERIAPTTVNLADTTQDAMVTLNHNQSRVYATDLEGLAKDIYNQSRLIDQTVSDFEKYTSARQEVRRLGQTLRLKSKS